MPVSEARTPRGIDPRGPRVAASITTVLLAVATLLALTGVSTARATGPAAFGWFAYRPLAGTDFAVVAGRWLLPRLSVAERAAALAFVAAFLNAVFGLCLGCRLYLLLQRLGFVGRTATA